MNINIVDSGKTHGVDANFVLEKVFVFHSFIDVYDDIY